jgi:hypothetical protein
VFVNRLHCLSLWEHSSLRGSIICMLMYLVLRKLIIHNVVWMCATHRKQIMIYKFKLSALFCRVIAGTLISLPVITAYYLVLGFIWKNLVIILWRITMYIYMYVKVVYLNNNLVRREPHIKKCAQNLGHRALWSRIGMKKRFQFCTGLQSSLIPCRSCNSCGCVYCLFSLLSTFSMCSPPPCNSATIIM